MTTSQIFRQKMKVLDFIATSIKYILFKDSFFKLKNGLNRLKRVFKGYNNIPIKFESG